MSSASTLLVVTRRVKKPGASAPLQHELQLTEEEFDFPTGSLESVAAAEAKLQSDSMASGDSRIWICAQSVTDCFFYLHVEQGNTIRALVLSEIEGAQWERVEGKTEPWEREAFEDEVVFGPDDEEIPLVQDDRWPVSGDIAIAPDAMKYAHAALAYWRDRFGTSA